MGWCLVAVGGAFGALARVFVSGLVTRTWPQAFPYGTLIVNAIGSFLLCWGHVVLVRREWPLEWRMGLLAGALGAFTTFSTFSFETLQLLENRRWLAAALNVVGSVGICGAAGFAGFALARSTA